MVRHAHRYEVRVPAPLRKWKEHWASGELDSNPAAATLTLTRGSHFISLQGFSYLVHKKKIMLIL